MSVSVIDPVNLAFERIKQLLFRPFRARRWLRLGFSAWLTTVVESTTGVVLFGLQVWLQVVNIQSNAQAVPQFLKWAVANLETVLLAVCGGALGLYLLL